MNKCIIVLFLNVASINAQLFSPKADIDFNLEPFFPSNQQIFDAKGFQIDPNTGRFDNDPIDTLVPISNFLKWLPGYSVTGKFEILTFLHLGTKIKFEHYFNSYSDRNFDETEAVWVSTPIDLSIFNIRGGLFSSINVSKYVKIEPEVNLLFVKSRFLNHLGTTDFVYSINKYGILSALTFLYSHSDNLNICSEFIYLTYSDLQDFLINPYLRIKINNILNGNIGLSLSPMTSSIKTIIGINLSIPLNR